jgi:outer membrane protein OmpU
MNNLKKLGLSALAGSLVAFSASAGELSVSGGAKLSFTNKGGNEAGAEGTANTAAQNDGVTGSGWGMQQAITFSGSGELDNGMIASLSHTMQDDGGTGSTSTIALDMGSMGTVSYNQSSGSAAIGIEAFDDVMPTAEEEVGNGLGILAEHSATSTAVGAYDYQVDHPGNGFSYKMSADMYTIVAGYSHDDTSKAIDDGGTTGAGTGKSSQSIGVKVAPMDGLAIYAGTGEEGVGDNQNDMETFAITYAMGPVSVGAQKTDYDFNAANSGALSDAETTQFGIAFAVNENLSISYGTQETELDGQAKDVEIDGFSIGYSMGGISLKAHANKGENMGGVAANEIEHTEISVSFAF